MSIHLQKLTRTHTLTELASEIARDRQALTQYLSVELQHRQLTERSFCNAENTSRLVSLSYRWNEKVLSVRRLYKNRTPCIKTVKPCREYFFIDYNSNERFRKIPSIRYPILAAIAGWFNIDLTPVTRISSVDGQIRQGKIIAWPKACSDVYSGIRHMMQFSPSSSFDRAKIRVIAA